MSRRPELMWRLRQPGRILPGMRSGGIIVLMLLLAACKPSGDGISGQGASYRTITCGDYAALANADDAVTNGALDIANAYLDASPVDPTHGLNDVSAFGDQIVALCQTATDDTRIIDLKAGVVSVFLAKHPEDAP